MYNSGLNKRKYVLIGSAQILLQEKQKILTQKNTLVMSFNYPWKTTIPPLEIPRPRGDLVHTLADGYSTVGLGFKCVKSFSPAYSFS